ncbi:MAG TPA: T9SS type A sorting domain-containing protein, partial [Candidatus Kapabacteria bacterium]|nr:T9SS type A sorting domain-containing protein [Candidatus Kapabacteria bacterium]
APPRGSADGRLIAGGFTGVFSSTDRGATWERTDADLPSGSMIASMATIQHDGEYSVWISVMSEGVYEFDADKIEWDKECEGLPEYGSGYPNFSKLFEANGKLYGVTEKHTYEFDFVKEEWKSVDALVGKNLQAYGGKLYSSSGDGVESSTDGGVTWGQVGTNFRFANVSEFAAARKAVLAIAQNGIFRTTDAGNEWRKTADFHSEDITAGHGVAYTESLEGVMRSTDDGLTWELSNSGIDEDLYHMSTVSANGSAVFAGFYDIFSFHGNSHWNSGGIYRSTNNGGSWEAVNTGMANDGFAYAPINQIEAFDDVQFALAVDGLYRSTNNGERWTKAQVNIDPVQDMFTQLVRTAGDTIYLVTLRSMFRSTNAGATWAPYANGLQNEPENHGTLLVMENTIYLKSYNMMGEPRLYKLENNAWESAQLEIAPGVEATTFFPFGPTLYAGTTEASVWVKSITSSSVGSDVSAELSLESYPNPFSTTATVSFALPRSSYVRAGLYDLTGKMVQELGSGLMPEGRNSLELKAGALPAGSYVCRIITEQGVAQEQVVLLP